MKKFIVLIAFVSSCGPYKSDSCSIDRSEAEYALVIAQQMERDGESCDAIQDFLLDTALDHNIEWDCD